MRGLTLANSGSQVGELSMQHAHPHILHPKISSRTINVLIWLVTLHMVSYSGVPWTVCALVHHAIVRALNTQFLLSLYCSQRLYSVMSRRGSNDHWLGWSLKWAGQTLIPPSAIHVSVNLPFEGESSTAPLAIFLVGILYFVICFQAVSRLSANMFSAA